MAIDGESLNYGEGHRVEAIDGVVTSDARRSPMGTRTSSPYSLPTWDGATQ
jgi:hypothetical protein